MFNKFRLKKLSKSQLNLIGLVILLIVLPFTLIFVRTIQDQRSSAAAPDKLEAEAGILTSTGVSKQNDSGASGGSYVLFKKNISPSPTLTPSLSTSKTYGVMARGSSLNNIRIGYLNHSYAYRFRAKYTGTIKNMRVYWLDEAAPKSNPGNGNYSKGDGGIFTISFQTVNNLVPSGNKLLNITGLTPPYEAGWLLDLGNGVKVNAGVLYAIVFENSHSDKLNNYSSLDLIWGYGKNDFGKDYEGELWENWGLVRRTGSNPWETNWGEKNQVVPILDLGYSDGRHQGYGYVNVFSHDDKRKIITGTYNKARLVIKPSTEKIIKTINVATLRYNTGTDNLLVQVKNSYGNLITKGVIDYSNYPVYTSQHNLRTPEYGKLTFDQPITLFSGQTYYVEFSVDNGGNTQYKFAGMRKGRSFGYHKDTYWADADSQETSDGKTWIYPMNWGSRLENNVEWMVYFEII